MKGGNTGSHLVFYDNFGHFHNFKTKLKTHKPNNNRNVTCLFYDSKSYVYELLISEKKRINPQHISLKYTIMNSQQKAPVKISIQQSI